MKVSGTPKSTGNSLFWHTGETRRQQMKPPVLIIDACQFTINYNYCLLDALSKKGQKVVYATTEFAYEDVAAPVGVNVRYCFFYLARVMSKITPSPLVRRILRGIEYPFNTLALLVYIEIRRIKVVHIMWPVFVSMDYWVIRLIRALGCRVVFTAHNPFPHESKPSDVKRYSRLYREVDWVIGLTNFTRDEIVSRSGVSAQKISVIPHGDFGYIFSQYPSNESLAEQVRRKAAGKRIIAFLGIIRPYKGLEYFIQAFELIKRQRPETFFLVAGSVLIGDQQRLEQQLAESCKPSERWVDIRFLPTPDMKAYLSVTDVLVQPYVSASQSGNTAMAYTAGVPVISTNVGGLAETTEDGRTGYVIPPRNPHAIADAVAKCLKGNNLAKMSEIARSWVAERYNWQTIAAQTAEVYHRLERMAKES